MAWVIYDNFMLVSYDGSGPVDLDTDTINCMLTTSTYTPNKATHNFKDDITNEVAGSNYSAGGAALAGKSLSLSSAVLTWDASDVTWSQHGSGFANAKYAVLYKSVGSASSAKPLIAYADIGSSKGNVAGDLTLQMSASGIITMTN